MARSRLPKSTRKHLRRAKAQIRTRELDRADAERKISALVADIRGKAANRAA